MKVTKLIASAVAAVVAASTLVVSAGAYSFFKATTSEFTIPEGSAILTHRLGITEIPVEYRDRTIWDGIGDLSVTFQLHDKGGNADPTQMWIQTYMQQPNNDTYVEDLDHWTWVQFDAGITDGTLEFDKDYTLVLNVGDKINTEKNYMGTIGFQIGTGDIDEYNVEIEFKDVTFTNGDAAEAKCADAAPVEETAPVDEGAATEIPVTTTTEKGSPDTGVEGVAAIAGIAVLAAGAVVLSKKRK